MHCPHCHFEAPEGILFCGRCGYKLFEQCPRCNREVPPEYKFCGYCGCKLFERCPSCNLRLPPDFRFCGFCGKPLTNEVLPLEPLPKRTPLKGIPSLPSPSGETEAMKGPIPIRDERRDVTVLFADVKGFTTMSEKLDPEEVHEIMNECFEGLGRIIKEEGGHVDKYIGDNIMALFGAPIAHENDPTRALRAALKMQGFLEKFGGRCEKKSGIPIQMRIGIHCGLVISGGLGSGDVKKDYTVMGDTVNLASRLESAAQPGTILVSVEMKKRTKGQFEFGSSQSLMVKGKEKPVEAYQLFKGVTDIDPRGRDGLSVPIVGREKELKALLLQLKETEKKPDWLEIRGEMGIGKTALLEEALKQFPSKKALMVAASFLVKQRPFGMVRRLLHSILKECKNQVTLPKTFDLFSECLSAEGDDLKMYFPALWYIAAPEHLRIELPDPDPKTLKRMIEKGITLLVEKIARTTPSLLLCFDSFEFSDKESAVLFESWNGLPGGLPVSCLITSRCEGRKPLFPEKVIDLKKLAKRDSNRLLTEIIRGAQLTDSLKEDILKRTDGIPLHIEEMVRTLLDQGILKRGSAGSKWIFDPSKMTGKKILPPSIRSAMTARLDKLEGRERDLLNFSSIQGMEFDLRVVEKLPSCEKREIAPSVPWLMNQNYIARVDETDLFRMVFCHPLLQETCYQTIMIKIRQQLHFETAEALCALAGGEEKVLPDLLAYHYELAGKVFEAARANLLCGQKAAELFANEEAIQRYHRVIQGIGSLEERGADEKRLLFKAYAERARIHLRVGEYLKVEESLREIPSFAVDGEDQAEVRYLSAQFFFETGKTDTAEGLFEEGLEILEKACLSEAKIGEGKRKEVLEMEILLAFSNLLIRESKTKEAIGYLKQCEEKAHPDYPLLSIRCSILSGVLAHTEGRFSEAVVLYTKAYEAAKEKGTLSERARAGNNLGNAMRDQGKYEEAKEHYRQALELWERIGDVECVAGAHNNLGNIAMSLGDFKTARGHQNQTLAICEKVGNTNGIALAQTNLAILANEEGCHADAILAAKEAIQTLGKSGRWLKQLARLAYGEGLFKLNEFEEGEKVFQGIQKEETLKSHPLAIAGALRGMGRIALARDNSPKALKYLEEAVQIFQKLKRTQEVARTLVDKALVFLKSKEKEKASQILKEALLQFQSIHAAKDIEKTEKLLTRINDRG